MLLLISFCEHKIIYLFIFARQMSNVFKYGLLYLGMLLAGCTDEGGKEPTSSASLIDDEQRGPVIDFDADVQDLGTIRDGEQVAAWFTYTNTGHSPLIIQDIKAGCGCTAPKWNDKPLGAGESETIRIIFNSAGKKGTQNIRISVFSNAGNPKEDLYLKARVININ